jgi:hypothetical protein
MSGLRKLTTDRRGAAGRASSRLTSLIGRLGNQVLWFGRAGSTRVVMISPSVGTEVELFRRCLDTDDKGNVDVEPTVM